MPNIFKNHQVLNLTLTLFLTISLVITAYAITQVRDYESEAKGPPSGKGGGKPKPSTTCSVAVEPNPVTSGGDFVINATGFFAYQQVSIYASAAYGMFADANGNVVLTLTAGPVGSQGVFVSKLVDSRWVECGSTTYQVI